jgi:CRISPR-associated protein Cas1
LLLREAGYVCDNGVLYFAEARKRVTVHFDDELIARTMQVLSTARAVARLEDPPPPLVDNPKCSRCSLVGICLPDETNLLADRTTAPPRRLVPRDRAPRPLYVSEQGAAVGVNDGRVEVRRADTEVVSVRLIDVSQLCVFGSVQVSSQLLRKLFALDVPVCWFSYGGWFQGMATGLPSKHVELRRRQFAFCSGESDVARDAARRMVAGKIRNGRTMLRRNARVRSEAVLGSMQSSAKQALVAGSFEVLLGYEGAAARAYFSVFSTMLRDELTLPGEPFAFEGRNRRPPKDAVNALLSFAYALLVKDLTAACFAVGLDPYVGVYHRPRFGRPALALDLAEELRPLVCESIVINAVNNGEIKPSHFVVRAGGVALTAEGRRVLIRAYERRLDVQVRHPLFGYKISYRRLLDVQTRLLAAYLMGEVPNYTAFETR